MVWGHVLAGNSMDQMRSAASLPITPEEAAMYAEQWKQLSEHPHVKFGRDGLTTKQWKWIASGAAAAAALVVSGLFAVARRT